MRLHIHLTLFLTALLAMPLPALAQDANAPTLVMDEEEFADLSVDFDESFNVIDSPYLADSIRLNYQINLLTKMTERQAELLKISDSFAALGLPFQEPAPARGLCAQLPPNTPCMTHYPDLYQPLVDARKAVYEEKRRQAAQAAGLTLSSGSVDDPAAIEAARKQKEEQMRRLAEAKAKAAKIERETRYLWSDVSCIAMQCQSVIVGGMRAPTYRATVRKGTRLADGTLIEDISTRGVRVIIDGDRIDLRPAPSGDGTDAQSASAADAMANVLVMPGTPDGAPLSPETIAVNNAVAAAETNTDGVKITNMNAPAAAPQAATPVVDAGSQDAGSGTGTGDAGTSTVQPVLGPSGLF